MVDQDFTDFEIVIIDDGSTDNTVKIIRQWQQHEPRLRLYSQTALGIVAALNDGLQRCQASLIARMDADDLMHPSRLSIQYAYLCQHPQVDLVTSRVSLFPQDQIQGGYAEYMQWQNACLSHTDIAAEIYVESPIAHPSVMIRKDCLDKLGGYRQGDFPEDYELWLRMLEQACIFYKLPDVLLNWRESETRASRTDSRYSRIAFDQIRARYLARDARLQTRRPLYVWGAGRRTRQRVAYLMAYGYQVNTWIDIDPKKIGNKINGAWVKDQSCLLVDRQTIKPFVLCYVNNHGARGLIKQQLEEMGYCRGEDFLMVG